MQKVDIAELRRLHEAAMQETSTPQDLRKSMNAAYLALPALLDELEAAREEVAELKQGIASANSASQSYYDKILWYQSQVPERDRRMKLIGAAVKEERTALAADNERLRAALEEIGKQLDACKTFVVGGCMGQTTDNIMKATVYHRVPYMLRELVLAALAATPAQSLEAHDAAVLRRLAAKLDGEGHPANEYYRNWLMAEADRVEKEATNA